MRLGYAVCFCHFWRQDIGYVYTGSDMFRSVWDRIYYGTDPLCLHGTGSKLERYGSIWDHLHKRTHLVPDSRSDPYRIHQVPCKHKTYPYQFRTGSKRIRSRVNAAINNPFDLVLIINPSASLHSSKCISSQFKAMFTLYTGQ